MPELISMRGEELDVLRNYRNELEKRSLEEQEVLKVLRRLGRVKVTILLLQLSGVGQVVAEVGRRGEQEVARRSKSLLDSWKEVVRREDRGEERRSEKKKNNISKHGNLIQKENLKTKCSDAVLKNKLKEIIERKGPKPKKTLFDKNNLTTEVLHRDVEVEEKETRKDEIVKESYVGRVQDVEEESEFTKKNVVSNELKVRHEVKECKSKELETRKERESSKIQSLMSLTFTLTMKENILRELDGCVSMDHVRGKKPSRRDVGDKRSPQETKVDDTQVRQKKCLTESKVREVEETTVWRKVRRSVDLDEIPLPPAKKTRPTEKTNRETPGKAASSDNKPDCDEKTSDEKTNDERTSDEKTNDEMTSDENTNDEKTSDEKTNDERTSVEKTNDERTSDDKTNNETPVQTVTPLSDEKPVGDVPSLAELCSREVFKDDEDTLADLV